MDIFLVSSPMYDQLTSDILFCHYLRLPPLVSVTVGAFQHEQRFQVINIVLRLSA